MKTWRSQARMRSCSDITVGYLSLCLLPWAKEPSGDTSSLELLSSCLSFVPWVRASFQALPLCCEASSLPLRSEMALWVICSCPVAHTQIYFRLRSRLGERGLSLDIGSSSRMFVGRAFWKVAKRECLPWDETENVGSRHCMPAGHSPGLTSPSGRVPHWGGLQSASSSATDFLWLTSKWLHYQEGSRSLF